MSLEHIICSIRIIYAFLAFVSESGQSLACVDNHAMLKCDPDQVIEIDESFYGRNTTHYCRANHSPFNTSVQDRCSWADVVRVVSRMSFSTIFQVHR